VRDGLTRRLDAAGKVLCLIATGSVVVAGAMVALPFVLLLGTGGRSRSEQRLRRERERAARADAVHAEIADISGRMLARLRAAGILRGPTPPASRN
jgi:hypothetical protein